MDQHTVWREAFWERWFDGWWARVANHRSDGPDIGSNSGGRQSITTKKGKYMCTHWWVFTTASLNLFSQNRSCFYLNVFAVLNEPLLADSVKKKTLFFQPSVRMCNNSCGLVKSRILSIQTSRGKKQSDNNRSSSLFQLDPINVTTLPIL